MGAGLLGHTPRGAVLSLVAPAAIIHASSQRFAPALLLLVGAGIGSAALLRLALHGIHRPHGLAWADWTLRLYMGLDTRADALLVGCLVGLLAVWNLLPRSPLLRAAMPVAALVAVAVLAFLSVTHDLEHRVYYRGLFTVVAMLVGVILVHMLLAPSRPGLLVLESGPLVGLGRISYGVYLFHIPLFYYLRPASLGWASPGTTMLMASLAIGAGALSYHCIEKPCRFLSAANQGRARAIGGGR